MRLLHGDCLDLLPTLAESSVDACVTDPPYGLEFMGKEWDGQVPGKAYWYEVRRVLRPGAYLLAFGGTRTFHRLAVAIEDSGFAVQDCLSWLYGQGFPKGKTQLKPAWEPILLAHKPGKRTLNVDECRIPADWANEPGRGETWLRSGKDAKPHDRRAQVPDNRRGSTVADRVSPAGRWPANVVLDEWADPVLRMKHNAPVAVREYFNDYGPVSGVRIGDPNLSQPAEACSVLQPQVLRGGPVQAERQPAPDVRSEALPGILGADASGETPNGEARTGESKLEGRDVPDEARIRDGSAARPAGSAGASPRNGARAGAAPVAERDRPPQERREGRQPAGELGAAGPFDTQAGTLRDPPRTPRIEVRERAPEVLASDVPEVWLKYFEPTGLAVRAGAAALLDEQSAYLHSAGYATDGLHCGGTKPSGGTIYNKREPHNARPRLGDSGGASRFFYTAKADSGERHYAGRNNHPTVKPVDLMRWLCRLVTPKGGTVLDPFMGSGSTGIAALAEGFDFIGIEREAEWVDQSKRRIKGPLFAVSS